MSTFGTGKKIVLITSGQPSLNPRLVKEADSLAGAGYDVRVLYQYWNDWGTQLDKKLLSSKKWQAIRVGGTPQANKIVYWQSRLRHKAGQKLMALFGFKSPFAEMAIGRCTSLLVNEALKHKADLYIAHNLAALPAAVIASKNNSAKCGFDAEDFHRYEVNNDDNNADVKLKKLIEDKYLPQVDYLTTSSPNISDAYRKLYAISLHTILNTFPSEVNLKPTDAVAGKLRLVWFSQTVAADRGVGDCIQALLKINLPDIELHLLGHASNVIKSELLALAGNAMSVTFYPPIPPDDITAFASQFDIGLAMENGVPKNRDICLTNKIFTYIQAGLALIASDTIAQQQLLNDYPGIGVLYKKSDITSLADAISYFYHHPAELKNARSIATKVAGGVLNWEIESQKFLELIKNTLSG